MDFLLTEEFGKKSTGRKDYGYRKLTTMLFGNKDCKTMYTDQSVTGNEEKSRRTKCSLFDGY